MGVGYSAFGVGLCVSGSRKRAVYLDKVNAFKQTGKIGEHDYTVTLPFREGASFTRHVNVTKSQTPPVYMDVGHGTKVPVGGGNISTNIDVKSLQLDLTPYPEVKRLATTKDLASENIVWKEIGKIYKGGEKLHIQTGEAPLYHFYHNEKGLEIVSDSTDMIAKSLLGMNIGTFLIVVGSIATVAGIYKFIYKD